MATAHIIGAGLSGLSAAVRLAKAGIAVVLYEGANHAGGRARSFHDETLGCRIDNGNHLMMSGNRTVRHYLQTIGSEDSLIDTGAAVYPFLDLDSGARWAVRPGAGRLPWWIFSKDRRIPGTSAVDYMAVLKLLLAGKDKTVADCFDRSSLLYQRFWEPLTLAALNTPPEEGAAVLLASVFRETFARGSAHCRPLVAAEGLSESFVDPALAYITANGGTVCFKSRLRGLAADNGAVDLLRFAPGGGKGDISLAPSLPGNSDGPGSGGDAVILALPPERAAEVLPWLEPPEGSYPIVNVHFLLKQAPAGFDEIPFIGLIGGTAHWLFVRGNIAAVTVSAARDLAGEANDLIAATVWRDVARALDMLGAPLPPFRVINEKRATFAGTPASLARRHGTTTRYGNLFLAGDWTDTGLPATIEGALRSGYKAADAAIRHFGGAPEGSK
ncbi:MAG: FAD-dependent oxidoreductase [Proteobacteria bacterium]|nr:FAD-dependent oxidoreductase [Pseudomonadota bacterium]